MYINRKIHISLQTLARDFRIILLCQTRQAIYIQRNIEARSCNHSCGGNALRIIYSEFMFVALGILHRVLVGKPEGKRPLGRPRRRWEDNIKIDLQEVGGSCGDWMELAQDRDR